MKKFIDGIPFCTNRHYNCVYVVLDSLLRFYGYEPTVPCFSNWDFIYLRSYFKTPVGLRRAANAVAGVGPIHVYRRNMGGLSHLVRRVFARARSAPGVLRQLLIDKGEQFAIRGRTIPLPKLLNAFGIELLNLNANDGPSAWNALKELIDTDTPVAVSLDVFLLAQAGLFPRQRHADHQYIVVGYDDEAATVHLVDPSPWQPSERSIPLDLFLSCWDMSAILKEGGERYNWAWLEVPARRPSLNPRQVSAILQRNLKSMSASSDQAHLVVGLEGIEQLAEDTGVWTGYEKPFLKAHLKRCAEQILEIALLREGHGHFLHHISSVCDCPGLAVLGQEFGSISQSWFVVRNLCLKGAIKETTSVVPRIQARFYDLAARERTALATLAEVADLQVEPN